MSDHFSGNQQDDATQGIRETVSHELGGKSNQADIPNTQPLSSTYDDARKCLQNLQKTSLGFGSNKSVMESVTDEEHNLILQNSEDLQIRELGFTSKYSGEPIYCMNPNVPESGSSIFLMRDTTTEEQYQAIIQQWGNGC